MIGHIVDFLKGLPPQVITVVVAMLPVAELRGSIPVALGLGLQPPQAWLCSVVGNMIPVVPILLLLGPVSKWLRRFRIWDKFFSWLFARTQRKSEIIQKYGFWGLIAFVAIPLPVTGAWTGCVAAFLLQMEFRKAFFAILTGVLIASIIVLCASMGFIKIFF